MLPEQLIRVLRKRSTLSCDIVVNNFSGSFHSDPGKSKSFNMCKQIYK
uniref:Uncharacterized protein n=1 Tax=Arundo donax TaxID=35708 RepID=A0A0A8YSM5_ARUDO